MLGNPILFRANIERHEHGTTIVRCNQTPHLTYFTEVLRSN